MSKCPIMARIKTNYENPQKYYLTRRVPVIIRLDGNCFSNYTKGLDKPFDKGFIKDMQLTAQFLCEQIQGCKVAYTQSDEITLLLTDFDTLQTQPWFGYSKSKVESISASMATAKFNQLRMLRTSPIGEMSGAHLVREDKMKLGWFDSRAFNVPKEEVANVFYARQRDAVKNSISMLAQSLYSTKELHKKNQSDMQEMCFAKGHNWNDLESSEKRGTCVRKRMYWNGMLVDDSSYYKTKDYFMQDNEGPILHLHTVEGQKEEAEDVVVRTKWNIEESPLVFKHSYFSKFLNTNEFTTFKRIKA